MGHGESQIGYLANYIIIYDGCAHQPALRSDRRAAMYNVSYVRDKLIVENGSRRNSAVVLIVGSTLFESLTVRGGQGEISRLGEFDHATCERCVFEAFVEVATTLGGAGNWTAETCEEWPRQARDFNSWTC